MFRCLEYVCENRPVFVFMMLLPHQRPTASAERHTRTHTQPRTLIFHDSFAVLMDFVG